MNSNSVDLKERSTETASVSLDSMVHTTQKLMSDKQASN